MPSNDNLIAGRGNEILHKAKWKSENNDTTESSSATAVIFIPLYSPNAIEVISELKDKEDKSWLFSILKRDSLLSLVATHMFLPLKLKQKVLIGELNFIELTFVQSILLSSITSGETAYVKAITSIFGDHSECITGDFKQEEEIDSSIITNVLKRTFRNS